MLTRPKKDSPETRLAMTSARWKSACAVYCANVVRPDLDEAGKRKLANDILTLGDNQDRTRPKRRISSATVEEMFFRQSQCIHRNCPLLLFSKQLAEELNAFFEEEE